MAIFQFLGQLPLSAVTSLLVVVLLVIFTVTSVDSGALVADNLASNGRTDTPRPQRVLWVFLIGLVATTLLVLGWRRWPEGSAVGHHRHGTALPRLDGGADPRLHQGAAAGPPALSRSAVSP